MAQDAAVREGTGAGLRAPEGAILPVTEGRAPAPPVRGPGPIHGTAALPLLNLGTAAFGGVCLIGGWAGAAWPWVLALLSGQGIGNGLLVRSLRSGPPRLSPRCTVGLLNWSITSAVVLLAGGYPTPFWLAFLFGTVAVAAAQDALGIQINVALAAITLAVPNLAGGIDLRMATGIAVQLIVLVFVGAAAYQVVGHLAAEQQRHHAAGDELERANARLTDAVRRLEGRTLQMELLAEMTRMLQACDGMGECQQVVQIHLRRLFPRNAGAFFAYSASRNELECVASWGGYPAGPQPLVFAPDDCWGLRRGQPFRADRDAADLRCRHAREAGVEHYVCIPLMAHGDALGVLHIRTAPNGGGDAAARGSWGVEEMASASAAGEQIALALANHILRESLRDRSIRDTLTGLFNRRYADETLDLEIVRAARRGGSIAVLMLDLDRFKRLNDSEGHEVGDAVLQAVGRTLQFHCRPEDLACRYGGEEFLLVLGDIDAGIARRRADAIRQAVRNAQLHFKDRRLGRVTASVGVALFPEHGTDRETLLRAADQALYRAKAAGRDRVEVAAAQGGGPGSVEPEAAAAGTPGGSPG